MNLTDAKRKEYAQLLLDAEKTCTTIDPLTDRDPALGIDDGYAIQHELIHRSGRKISGLKAALTSKAKQRAMGVAQPGFGVVFSSMRIAGQLARRELIHPRVEPEIAVFFEQFHQTGEMTAVDVRRRACGLSPALEVIDSRYTDFKFTAADVFADNCSFARYILSERIFPVDFPDLERLGILLEKNGRIVQTGTPAAVLESPFASAAFILNLAYRKRLELPGSFVVLTGGITEAVPVDSGDRVRGVFHGMGDCMLHIR